MIEAHANAEHRLMAQKSNEGERVVSGGRNPFGVVLEKAHAAERAGHLSEAEAGYKTVLKKDPNNTEALHLLGKLACRTGHAKDGVNLIGRAVKIDPNNSVYYNSLGVAFQLVGNIPASRESFERAIAINPENTEAHKNLGSVLVLQKCHAEAVEWFRRAIDLDYGYASAHTALGKALFVLGNEDEGLDECRTAFRLDPHNLFVRCGLVDTLVKANALEDVLKISRKTVDMYPCDPEALHVLGKAEESQGNLAAARKTYERALQASPNYPDVGFSLFCVHMLMGNMEAGWPLYKTRWNMRKTGIWRDFSLPFWSGEELSGKRILVWMEQGIGDEIMFAGILPDLVRAGAMVTVECEPRLVPLFTRSFSDITVIGRADPPDERLLRGFDMQVPAGDLPIHLRTKPDDFSGKPYLQCDHGVRNKLRARYLSSVRGERLIGVTWRGGDEVTKQKRSLDLEVLAPILDAPNCRFVSLQHGDVQDNLSRLLDETGLTVIHDPDVDPLTDMDAHAAQVAAMDQVISVDNSTVHLAGALGVPTWVMLPAQADWRWFQGGERALWYDSLHLFRQQQPGQWDIPVAKVRESLDKMT